MLAEHVERYLNLRATLGYKLRDTKRELRALAKLAESRGENVISIETARMWSDAAPSPYARCNRMRRVILFAKFMHAEDPRHEVPSFGNYHYQYVRPLPYIYSQNEIIRILAATTKLQKQKPHRREMYQIIIGLIAATGLRVSEALNLKFSDIKNGVLSIRDTKFGKTRLVPLHSTTIYKLNQYLDIRRQWVFDHDYIFTARDGAKLSLKTLHYNFCTLLKFAKIAPEKNQRPRIHDLRHTFATRALEQCLKDRKSINKHFVALSTYLGHVNVKSTYWYLEATPNLMREIAESAENFMRGES